MVARFQQIYCVQPDLSRLYCGPFGGILGTAHRQNPRSFFARMRALVLAMTVRTILILVVASMIGPSLAFSSPACMTESEALAKFPKATHLYMRQNCWSDSAIAPVHSPRPPRGAGTAPPARPTLAVAHETVNSGTDAGVQCQYSPCE